MPVAGALLNGLTIYRKLAADVTNSTVSLADCTGLDFDLTPGAVYSFHFWIIFQSAATTTGIQLALAGPAGGVVYDVRTPTSASATTLSNRRAGNTGAATTAIDVANANSLALIEGICSPNAAGTMIVRFASSLGGSLVTIKAGSIGMFVAV